MKDVDEYLKDIRESQLIRCPYCNNVYEDDDSYYKSCSGDEFVKEEVICYHCDNAFLLTEILVRTYETEKKI